MLKERVGGVENIGGYNWKYYFFKVLRILGLEYVFDLIIII